MIRGMIAIIGSGYTGLLCLPNTDFLRRPKSVIQSEEQSSRKNIISAFHLWATEKKVLINRGKRKEDGQ